MARKPASTRTRQAAQSPDCFSGPFLICLLKEVGLMLEKLSSKTGETREIESHIKSGIADFFKIATSNETEDRPILERLFGKETAYPMKRAAVAHALSISVDSVLQAEERCITNMIARSNAIVNELQTDWIRRNPCPDCDARLSNMHKAGCAQEECPFCYNKLSVCFCAYKKLHIRYGGQSKRDWDRLRKQEGTNFNPRKHARSLTPNEQRTWENIVFQKGCIPYGRETRFS